jgi:DNA-binding NarL/FixJ family response regulator
MMALTRSISILIADDHPIFRNGLKLLLEKNENFALVGEASNGMEAWTSIQNLKPEIAILDLEMPELDGIQVARRVARHQIPVRLVILTMYKDPDLLRQALDLGVMGYLLKDDATMDVERCLKSVHEGNHFIAPGLSSHLLTRAGFRGNPSSGHLEDLTPSQMEVLKLIARGLQSKEIGEELGISYRTVENHRYRIATRLGLKGNNSLLRYALENKELLT